MFFIFRTTEKLREQIKAELKKARQGNRDNTDRIVLRALQVLNLSKRQKMKTEYEIIKRVAEIDAETDADTIWDITNTEDKKALWISAFIAGAMWMREQYKSVLNKPVVDDKIQEVEI